MEIVANTPSASYVPGAPPRRRMLSWIKREFSAPWRAVEAPDFRMHFALGTGLFHLMSLFLSVLAIPGTFLYERAAAIVLVLAAGVIASRRMLRGLPGSLLMTIVSVSGVVWIALEADDSHRTAGLLVIAAATGVLYASWVQGVAGAVAIGAILLCLPILKSDPATHDILVAGVRGLALSVLLAGFRGISLVRLHNAREESLRIISHLRLAVKQAEEVSNEQKKAISILSAQLRGTADVSLRGQRGAGALDRRRNAAALENLLSLVQRTSEMNESSLSAVLVRAERERFAYDEGSVWQESDRLQKRFHHVFDCPNSARGYAYFDRVLLDRASGADVLDFGCYNGEMVEDILKAGPRSLVGIDIAEKAIEEARSMYGHAGEFHVMDGHRMSFADESFDLVVGKAILHHLEYERAIREITRVLRPGGCALFFEPLRDNPGAKLMRQLTPRARTPDELPLSREQIESADRIFGNAEHMFMNLASVPAAMLTSLLIKNPDNLLTRAADKLDQAFAGTAFKYWMRSAVLVWEKRSG